MQDTTTQSSMSMIVGSAATVEVRDMGPHGIGVFIEDDVHKTQLSFFDALPLMTLINVLNTDETVRRFVDWRPDAERAVLVATKFSEAMRAIEREYSIDDPATHPAQPPEPDVVYLSSITGAQVRCPSCDAAFLNASGTTNLERLASATLGYAAHWAREHGR